MRTTVAERRGGAATKHCSAWTGGDVLCVIFFSQAEDGIRDLTVTGVQTCALPIYGEAVHAGVERGEPGGCARGVEREREPIGREPAEHKVGAADRDLGRGGVAVAQRPGKIGRASCRERGEDSVGAGSIKEKRRTGG